MTEDELNLVEIQLTKHYCVLCKRLPSSGPAYYGVLCEPGGSRAVFFVLCGDCSSLPDREKRIKEQFLRDMEGAGRRMHEKGQNNLEGEKNQ
jgi:hypothetical protein